MDLKTDQYINSGVVIENYYSGVGVENWRLGLNFETRKAIESVAKNKADIYWEYQEYKNSWYNFLQLQVFFVVSVTSGIYLFLY